MAKILLVEDDNNLREIYAARLQAEGYEIASAKDGEEALVVAKKEQPDLVIADVMMPRISGFEMLDILRNTQGLRDVRVIMLTALGQAEDKARADQLGADRYLVKSQVTLEDIVKAASDLLGNVPATSPAAVEEASAPAAAPTAAPQPAAVQPTAQPVQPAPAAPTVQAVPVAAPPPEPAAMPSPPSTPTAPSAPPEPPTPAPAASSAPSAPPATDQATNTEELAHAVNDLIKSTGDKTGTPTGTGGSTVVPEPLQPAGAAQPTPAPPAPAVPGPAPTPTSSTPAAPVQPTNDNATADEDTDSVTIARKKIIKPLGPDTAPSRPGLNDLLAKEGLDMNQPQPPTPHGLPTTPHPPGHVITPAGGTQQPPDGSGNQPLDPNKISL